MQLQLITILALASAAAATTFSANNALYSCGIRKRFGVQLIHGAWAAEPGQWPWHAALYQRSGATDSEYKCGGTLIDQRHVLTSAHCVVSSRRKALRSDQLSVHLGRQDLFEHPEHVLIVNVSEILVHAEFERNRHDIALLVLDTDVRYSEYVIPICLDKIQGGLVDDLVDRRGTVAGWGQTENGTISRQLKTATMTVVNNTACVQSDPTLFGRFISSAIFCAGDRNGTSVCLGDSGGGMYFNVGDHWELRGIVSFAGMTDSGSCDKSKFVVFTNVAFYFSWIRKQTTGEVEPSDNVPLRVSERKCREYVEMARKQKSGVCVNVRSPHTVAIIPHESVAEVVERVCSGVLISKKFVITVFSCFLYTYTMPEAWKVRISNYGDVNIKRSVHRPEYRRSQEYMYVDMVLFELSEWITFSSRLLPACLANQATENLYDTLLLNGYGLGHEARPQYVETVEHRLFSPDECQRTVGGSSGSSVLCTVSQFQEDETFIRGLRGGPLQTFNSRNCMFTVVGILSYRQERDSEQVNFYAQVAPQLDWIEQVVWGDDDEVVEATTRRPGTVAPGVAFKFNG